MLAQLLNARKAVKEKRSDAGFTTTVPLTEEIYPHFSQLSSESAYGNPPPLNLSSQELKLTKLEPTHDNLSETGDQMRSYAQARTMLLPDTAGASMTLDLPTMLVPMEVTNSSCATDPNAPFGSNHTTNDLIVNGFKKWAKVYREIATIGALNRVFNETGHIYDIVETSTDPPAEEPASEEEANMSNQPFGLDTPVQIKGGKKHRRKTMEEVARLKVIERQLQADYNRAIKGKGKQKEIQIIEDQIADNGARLVKTEQEGAQNDGCAQMITEALSKTSNPFLLDELCKLTANHGIREREGHGGIKIPDLAPHSAKALERTQFWGDFVQWFNNETSLEEITANGVQALTDQIDELVSNTILASAGIRFIDYRPIGDTNLEKFTDAVDTIEAILVQIQRQDAELAETRSRGSEVGKELHGLAKKIKECDVLTFMGGGIQIQRAFDICYQLAMHMFGHSSNKNVISVRREHQTKIIKDSSVLGQVMGIVEHGGAFHSSLEQVYQGRVTRAAVLNYIARNKVITMLRNETPPQYARRVHDILYIRLMTASKRSPGCLGVIHSAIEDGSLNVKQTVAIGIKMGAKTNAAGAADELNALCTKELKYIGSMTTNRSITAESMLEEFFLFEDQIKIAWEDYLTIQSYGQASGARNKSNTNLFTIMGEDIEEKEEEDQDPTPGSNAWLMKTITSLNEKIDTMNSQNTTAKPPKSKSSGRPPGRSLRTHRLLTESPGAEIVAANYRQLQEDKAMKCPYCGGPHEIENCALKIFDISKGQQRAHACQDYLEHLKKRGWESAVPPAGTIVPYPHGLPEAEESGATELAEAKAKIAELEEKVAHANVTEDNDDLTPIPDGELQEALMSVAETKGWSSERLNLSMGVLQTENMFNVTAKSTIDSDYEDEFVTTAKDKKKKKKAK